MKYIYLSLLFFLIVLLGSTSCNKDDADDVIVILTPSEYQFNANVGDYIPIGIKIESEVALSKLIITQTINLEQSTIVLDSSLATKKLNFEYSYLIPEPSSFGESQIKFVVTGIDSEGNSQKSTRIIIVNRLSEKLDEISGSEMFSRLASNKNAFNLIDLQPLNYLTADSTIRYIEDYSFDTIPTQTVDTLSRKWVSPAGIKFLKYNSFDYANATNESIKNSFLSGIETDFINDLREGDVILTYLPKADMGHEFYAIKIIYILDPAGVENDKYIFNIKH